MDVIYVYAENVSDRKGLDKEYEDLQNEVYNLKEKIKKGGTSYVVQVEELLKFPVPHKYNIIKEKRTKGGIDIRTLEKYFVFILLKYLLGIKGSLLYKYCKDFDCVCYVFLIIQIEVAIALRSLLIR